MVLREQKGNMYDWVTHTINFIKGECLNDCKYCYMKQFKLNKIRLDAKEIRADLGEGNYIFVGSSTDMWAENVPKEWIERVLNHCRKYPKNKYLFQSKNPARFKEFDFYGLDVTLGTTIETNKEFEGMWGEKCPTPRERAEAMSTISNSEIGKMVTIEPILQFDLNDFVDIIKLAAPDWVNIGADSKDHGLPEPTQNEIMKLATFLGTFTEVKNKSNLKRLVK